MFFAIDRHLNGCVCKVAWVIILQLIGILMVVFVKWHGSCFATDRHLNGCVCKVAWVMFCN